MNRFTHLLFVGLLLLSIQAWGQNTPVAKNGQLKVCGTKLCNQYGNAIQLRGMSTHGIQWYGWGDCLTEASLDALAYDWGSDILRISLYVQEGGWETNPSGYEAQVTTLINEATERGMYALVDWHQLSPGDPNYNLENAKKFFTNIANAHKNKNNIIYDICNEPNGVAWSRIKTYADQIIPVIRAIDSDAVILIGTHAWGSMGISDGRTAQDIVSNPVNFPNIMYTFHFYATDHRDQYLNELNWASDRLPVFVTEFGTQEASGDGPNDFTMAQKYIDLMRNKKISWTNWNYSDDNRSGAVWTSGTCSNGPWTTARLKPAGVKVRDWMLNPADDFPGGGNISPTVSITSPANGASFTAPASITINANAADSDGSVTKVEFFNGATSLGSDATSPYSFTWSSVNAGTYTITAKATDDKGAITTSSAVTVTVSNPVVQTPYGGTAWPIPGRIEAENYDLGGQNVAYNDGTTGNSGNSYRTGENVDIEATGDVGGGYNVGWATANEWTEYTVNVTKSATYKIEFRLGAITTGKTVRLEFDGVNVSGTVASPNTGAWTAFQTVTVNNVSLTAGQKVMRLFHITGDLNVNYINVVEQTTVNNPPAVNITAPSNGASYTAPANVTITANATDDGGVSKVEFFNGANLIGTDATSPYSVAWNSLAAGTYTITAKATDAQGLSTTSTAVSFTVNPANNSAPTVSITSPSNGATFTAPANITINATATDADGVVSKVEFYNGSNLLGQDATSPYSFAWNNVAAGTYTITAKATDDDGASTISSAITVTVNGVINQPPTASITSPANGASFTAPATITINANATDDGGITKVEFYNGSTLLGQDDSSPYSFIWNNVAAGSYSLTVKATDNSGLTKTSTVVTITVTASGGCTGIPTYSENAGYVAGSIVQNAGGKYECKPWPYSGWCNGAAWAYAPGTGAYWTDAWTKTGNCSAKMSVVSSSARMIDVTPNPTEKSSLVKLNADVSNAEFIVFNSLGEVVQKGVMNGSLEANIDLSSMENGIYMIRISSADNTWIEKIVKQ